LVKSFATFPEWYPIWFRQSCKIIGNRSAQGFRGFRFSCGLVNFVLTLQLEYDFEQDFHDKPAQNQFQQSIMFESGIEERKLEAKTAGSGSFKQRVFHSRNHSSELQELIVNMTDDNFAEMDKETVGFFLPEIHMNLNSSAPAYAQSASLVLLDETVNKFGADLLYEYDNSGKFAQKCICALQSLRSGFVDQEAFTRQELEDLISKLRSPPAAAASFAGLSGRL
jgi:hypothetical protein